MKKLLVIIGVIAIVCSCQQAETALTDEQKQKIADVIKQQFQSSMNMGEMNQEKFDLMLSNMTEKEDQSWVGTPALWLNELSLYPDKSKVNEVWRPKPDQYLHQKFFVDEDFVAVISEDCAIYIFKGSFAYVDKEGEVGNKTPMSGSYVYVKRDGEWKWLHMHQSWKN